MLRFRWALDNDYDVYLLGLPPGLTVTGFLATANTQAATALHADLTVTFVEGTYTIPATETTPAMADVAAYRGTWNGEALTERAAAFVGGADLYLIVREGQNMRRYAAIEVAEHEPLVGPADA